MYNILCIRVCTRCLYIWRISYRNRKTSDFGFRVRGPLAMFGRSFLVHASDYHGHNNARSERFLIGFRMYLLIVTICLPVIFSLLFFPRFFVLLCLQAAVFLWYICLPCTGMFFSTPFFFKSWPPRLRGGGARQIVSSSCLFYLFLLLFRLVFFVFVFSLRLFPFVFRFHIMCMPCLSYLLIKVWCDKALHCPSLLWLLHTGTWQRSISVA